MFKFRNDQAKRKPKRSYPFFINSARWRLSESYFKENYHPSQLHDFNWEYWESVCRAEGDTQAETVIQMDENENIQRMRNQARTFSISGENCPMRSDPCGRGDATGTDYDNVTIQCPQNKSNKLQYLLQIGQRVVKSISNIWTSNGVINNSNDKLGNTNERLSQGSKLKKSNSKVPEPPETDQDKACVRCLRWQESHKTSLEEESENMVEMSEDASFLVYRDRRGRRANGLRRVASSESEESTSSNDSLIAGPPMIDFNEPLPNILEHEAIHTNPISNGDARLSARDLDATLGNTSRENLQTVVSQLGLEIPVQSKSSCHTPQHLHSPQQSSCCRHAAHNISIESLDLGSTGGAGFSCDRNPAGNRFAKRPLSTRKSCSSIN